MKKLGIAFIMALLALAFVAVPASAHCGCGDKITCSEITVTDDSPVVGTTITFSGTVTACKVKKGHYSRSWYYIYDPDNNLVATENSGWHWTGYTYTWSEEVLIDLVGDYYAIHGGNIWKGCIYHPQWVTGCYRDLTVTSCLSNAPLATGRTRPILTVETSVDSDVYFPSEGWGDPTTDDIVYNDGTWQVEIADGTRILLDGDWHRKTWIEVDDQGNVIGKYGSSGHIIAEEIALSSPITITKVG